MANESSSAKATEALQMLILERLSVNETISSSDIQSDTLSIDSNTLFGALKSLTDNGKVIFETHEDEKWVLTEEGASFCIAGSPEYRVLTAILASMPVGIQASELVRLLGPEIAKIGQSICFRNKWINVSNGFLVTLPSAPASIQDSTAAFLSKLPCALDSLSISEKDTILDFKRRKLVDLCKVTSFKISRGPKYSTSTERPFLELTAQMVTSGTWKNRPFKQYNFNSDGPKISCGHLHPLLKVRNEFCQIFFELGFTEMPTNKYVDNSFWNFDALFVPQQHPARDSQDTFFVSNPSTSTDLPEDYLNEVDKIHSIGGFGSIGYRASWSREETHRNILRTHTTAISSRMLYKLAREPKFRPAKLFSIDKVFRNESVDATHLAEFHQIEGLIADTNLTLSDLKGFLHAFFSKLGMKKLRFKPTYNPYTEPSMEVFSFHPGLGKWIEVGNSGIFRPEMLRPMGFDESVSVIAWGLSLERPTMIKYQINNIRDLVGHKVDLNMIYSNPICLLD